ncbi:Flp pilus assembly protein CpaB [Bacillus timonensis]|nr:Flp pilus assembly protein CpaB [Bacillus timonensis]
MRSKVILFLALVMGIITTVLFFNYMKQFDTETVANLDVVDVVVAKERISTNQQLSQSMFQLASVPKDGLHPQTVTSIAEVEGLYAVADIEEGEVLLTHRMQSEKEENLYVSRKVKDGYRAVSVGLNIVQSVSNLIEPEDEVDVVFSEVVDKQTNEIVTKQILTKARVLAIGRKMVAVTSEEEEYVEYTSVTLELTPENAVTLINASERGSIQLTLHKRPVISADSKEEQD